MTHKSSTQIPKQKNLDVNSLFLLLKRNIFLFIESVVPLFATLHIGGPTIRFKHPGCLKKMRNEKPFAIYGSLEIFLF